MAPPPASAQDKTLEYRFARLEDGPALWSLAKANGLDENSPYAYLLWTEYFRDTTVVATDDADAPIGFVTGFLRPDDASTVFVWQVGVDDAHRRRGIAGRLLDELFERTDATALEATVTPSNSASETLFRRFGERHGLAVAVEPLFGEELFPPGHEAELRFRIGPAITEGPSVNPPKGKMSIFERLESEVRGYCRTWPAVFKSAHGHTMVAEDGTEYLDFFAGAGALNYGHNHPVLIEALQKHLSEQGFIHALDIATTTKRTFMERFEDIILKPRNLDYKVQFPGPTGTNAVEAALKLARKATGRHRVVGFTNGFHGMTLGSLAVTGNAMKRGGAGVPLGDSASMPFANYLGDDMDSLHILEAMISGGSSGLDEPAAVIVETTQGEGGINPASHQWMRNLDDICKRHGILLIVDDIQVGNGRTGPFFSFEDMGIDPDIVTLSKSISGSGLPMALVLMKPEHDVWSPGEHNGTFRGNNAAFVTATAALEHFWTDDELTKSTLAKSDRVRAGLEQIMESHPGLFTDVRGRGLILGIETAVPEIGSAIAKGAFERRLIIETAGAEDEVVKLLPPLTVTEEAIDRALEILNDVADSFSDDMVADLRAEREVSS